MPNMIQKYSHVTLYVLDQNVAHDFYVNKLGFEVRMDHDMGSWRWLTVSPPAQPDLQIVLLPVMTGPTVSQEDADTIRELVSGGKLMTGVMQTADCQKTYEELLAKGVEFKMPPTERFYGIEAIMKDPFGNWFSLTQPKEIPGQALK